MRALRDGEERPFDDVVLCNIGNPQSLGQVSTFNPGPLNQGASVKNLKAR